MVFHPCGGWLYLLTESGNRVYVFRLQNDTLTELAAYSTQDPDKKATGMAADIAIHPDGAFLYASNRGQNNVTVWRVLPSGLLDTVGYFDCGGAGPRYRRARKAGADARHAGRGLCESDLNR